VYFAALPRKEEPAPKETAKNSPPLTKADPQAPRSAERKGPVEEEKALKDADRAPAKKEEPKDPPVLKEPQGVKREAEKGKSEEPATTDAARSKVGRGGATAPEFWTVQSSKIADARERVLEELRRIGVPSKPGAGEYDSSGFAKDVCIEIELTDDQLRVLGERLAREKELLAWSKGANEYRRRKSEADDEDPVSYRSVDKADKQFGGGGGGATGKGAEDKNKDQKEEAKKPSSTDPAEDAGASGAHGDKPSDAKKKDGGRADPGAGSAPKRKKVVIYFHELPKK
jgi:hypothetical protein